MRTVILIGHFTVLRGFLFPFNLLQSHLRSANQGGEYLGYSLRRLLRPLSVISHSEKCTSIQFHVDLASSQF